MSDKNSFTATIQATYYIEIPKWVMEKMDWKEGGMLIFDHISGKGFTVRKATIS